VRQLPLRLWPVLRGGGAAKLLIVLSLELKSYKELLCWLACFVHEQRFPSACAEDRLEAPSPPFPASGLTEQSTCLLFAGRIQCFKHDFDSLFDLFVLTRCSGLRIVFD